MVPLMPCAAIAVKNNCLVLGSWPVHGVGKASASNAWLGSTSGCLPSWPHTVFTRGNLMTGLCETSFTLPFET